MSNVVLMEHQREVLNVLKNHNRCLLGLDMGLGKSFVSSEKLATFDFKYALVVCQKSLISMWVKHLKTNYPEWKVIDYTKSKVVIPNEKCVIVVNYDLVFRRPELMRLKELSVILDECTIISNPNTKRTKAIFKLDIKNIIMLSGTVSKGKYENLYTIIRLLGWNISKREFYEKYIIQQEINVKTSPFPIKIVVGYKNVENLKIMLRHYGSHFLKTEDVLSLPEQVFVDINVDSTSTYKRFLKDRIVETEGKTLIGDTTFTQRLYERMLCGQYNKGKLEAFSDLIESTDDRLIVFYNFNEELEKLKEIAKNRPISIINGSVKDKTAYDKHDNSITFVQYQAGAMGHNLQKANKIVYFTPTESAELWMQSLKRVHRIGQSNTCFYYKLTCNNSVEEKIYKAIQRGVDYTNKLFVQGE